MKILYYALFFVLMPIMGFAQVSQLSDFEGSERSGAVSVSSGSYGYVGLGKNSTQYFNDFWKYNPEDDSWTEMASFPGEGREQAVAFAIDDFIYVGIGHIYSGGFTYYDDFYKYSTTANEWTAIASFGGGLRSSAIAFAIGDFAYVGTGFSPDGHKNDLWKYNPSENSWQQLADAPGVRHGAVGFAINGKGYLSGGLTLINSSTIVYSDVQEYCPVDDTWTERVFANGMILSIDNASTFVLKGIAYIAYGNKTHVATYNPQNNQVVNLGDVFGLNNSRRNPIAFVVDDIAYFGMGNYATWSTTNYFKDFWKYTAPLPVPNVLNVLGGGNYCQGNDPTGVDVYMANSQFQISYQLVKDGDNLGVPLEGNGNTLRWENLNAGSYIVVASNGEDEVTMNGTITITENALVVTTVTLTGAEDEVCQGNSLTITANITNGGFWPDVKWFVNQNEQLSETGETFTYTPADGDVVTCEVTTLTVTCPAQNPVSKEVTVSVKICTSTEIISTQELVVFPNPVQSRTSVTLQDDRIVAVEVFRMNGQKIKSYAYSSATDKADIDLTDLMPGVYLMMVQGQNSKKSVKIVKK